MHCGASWYKKGLDMAKMADCLVGLAKKYANDRYRYYKKNEGETNLGKYTVDCCTLISRIIYDAFGWTDFPNAKHGSCGYYWSHINDAGFDEFLMVNGFEKFKYYAQWLKAGDIVITDERLGHTFMIIDDVHIFDANNSFGYGADSVAIRWLNTYSPDNWAYVYRYREVEKPKRTEFTDVTEQNVSNGELTQGSYDRIYWAVDKGIVSGFSDGTFCPTAEATRAQAAVMLYRLAKLQDASAAKEDLEKGKREIKFTDLDGLSDGAVEAVEWAYGSGVSRGYADGTFRPDEKITRLSAVIMLYRMAGKPDVSLNKTGFTDVDSQFDTDTFKSVAWAIEKGIAQGMTSETGEKIFGGDEYVQRQQMVTFIYRYYCRMK